MGQNLCVCEQPLHADDSTRWWCKACGGAAPRGRRLPQREALEVCDRAAGITARLRADLVYAEQATYGIRARPDHAAHQTGHSDPTAGGVTGGPRSDAGQWVALAGQWARQALAWLVLADEAAGRALIATDPHRGQADHVAAPYHDAQTLYPGRPDLQLAHAAKQRRAQRGEL